MMDASMKRSPLITIVNVLQSFLGLVLVGLTVYLLALTRSRETLSEPDASETVRGLLIGAIVLGVPALITLVAAWGLWKRRFWGWALSLATDVGMLAVLVYSMVGENDRDGDEIALAAGFVAPAVLLLLPAVRKFFWNAGTNTNQSF
jgi:succinate dehydrogenase/fumarate reductase cytochrome b subunit